MTSPIDELYGVKNGGKLPYDLCQEINKGLATIELNMIPKEQYGNVADYLASSLSSESVIKELVPVLDKLLYELQAIS